MSVQTFEHSILINATPETYSQLFFKLTNFIKTNPLVVEILEVIPGKTEDGQPYHTFYVIDRIPILGPLVVRFKYWVRMTKIRDEVQVKQIISETRSFPDVHLRNVVTFTAEGSGTCVHEEVQIETARLLMGFSLQQAKQSHRVLLTNLKTISETTK